MKPTFFKFLYNIGLMMAVMAKLVANKAKNTLLCLTVYEHNLFYYYYCLLIHKGMSSTKIKAISPNEFYAPPFRLCS
jgi:hypothetical protein